MAARTEEVKVRTYKSSRERLKFLARWTKKAPFFLAFEMLEIMLDRLEMKYYENGSPYQGLTVIEEMKAENEKLRNATVQNTQQTETDGGSNVRSIRGFDHHGSGQEISRHRG